MSRRSPLPPLACPACGAGLEAAQAGVRCPGCDVAYPEDEGMLRVIRRSQGPPGYDPHYFKTLPHVEDEHFWFVARRKVILEALRRTVPDLDRRPLFDIGCGTGGLLAFLADSGVLVAGGCDAYVEGLRLARRRLQAPLILVDEGRLPPLGPGQAFLSLFDVLEHLDDDRGALRWIASVLEPGGVLVLTVPAHPFLFDEMDQLACHRRRYGRGELRDKLREAGLEIRLLTHFMLPLVPLLLVLRRLRRATRGGCQNARSRRDSELSVTPGLNGLMLGVLGLERLWLRRGTLPFGSSLLAVAARPGPLREG